LRFALLSCASVPPIPESTTNKRAELLVVPPDILKLKLLFGSLAERAQALAAHRSTIIVRRARLLPARGCRRSREIAAGELTKGSMVLVLFQFLVGTRKEAPASLSKRQGLPGPHFNSLALEWGRLR
jgi:hypothetical protein